MKRKGLPILISIVLLVCLSCTTDTPWRKATVSTYELLGAGIGATRDTAEILRTQNVITDVQLAKIKDTYNKARGAYVAAGNALKLAGQVASASERDVLLAEYSKLLSNFAVLSVQLYDLVKGLKKVSYYDVMEWVKNGGEL